MERKSSFLKTQKPNRKIILGAKRLVYRFSFHLCFFFTLTPKHTHIHTRDHERHHYLAPKIVPRNGDDDDIVIECNGFRTWPNLRRSAAAF